MTPEEKTKNEIIQRFGDAYRAFGLNKLMGHVVALLIYSPKPLSLDEITKELKRSKGPVSQILKRLRDRKLVRKAWSPNDNRKDFYEIEPELFENAFRNNLELIKNNTRIAKHLNDHMKHAKKKEHDVLKQRLIEMEEFYVLMEKHHREFLNSWMKKRKSFYK